MGQIDVIKKNGEVIKLFSKEPLCTVTRAIQDLTFMGDDNVKLTIVSTAIFDFAVGDKIIIGGEEYSIRTKTTREILSEDLFSYEAVFYGVMYELMKSQYRDTDASGKSSRSSFDLTYTLLDFIKVLIYNVNRDYPGLWVFDEANCPETEPKTLQFSKNNCLQVLQSTCKEFGFEFKIDQKDGIRNVRIGKFGDVVNPPSGRKSFEYGKGAGLYKLKEQKIDDKSIITRLWVEGGTKNIKIDYRGYSDRLQLPFPKRLNQREHKLSDGTVIPAMSEMIGISDDNDRFIEDINLKNQIGSIEDTEQYDIHPSRTGIVTGLGDDIYSFVDSGMDFDLNEKDDDGNTRWLIGGVTAKITFITGKLAGQQFELKENGGYKHEDKTFTIIKYTDERGADFPSSKSEGFRIGLGDKYKITDINLPDSYVQSAEEDLWYAGYDTFLERKQARAQYVLTFEPLYFIKNMPGDSETSVFKCGDYVPIKDDRFGIEKNIRIQKVSRNLLSDHDYTITLSDTTTISIQTKTILDVLEHNIIIDNNRLRDLNKARMGWRTTEELRNMVYDMDGYFDPDNIKPNSIDTNMLTVGSRSQQFILVDVVLEANVNGLPNRFDATAGSLHHFTISNDNTTRRWNLPAISVTLSEPGGYYVFAKCSKDGETGVFHITQEQLRVENESDPNNYYFQIGIIGSFNQEDNFRDFTTTYGFTRINGNTITTGRIKSASNNSFFDLITGQISAGRFNESGQMVAGIDVNPYREVVTKLFGPVVQNPAGDESPLGPNRGDWVETELYYAGDKVYRNGSTYLCIKNTPTAGVLPTNTTYFKIDAAAGKDGAAGNKPEFRYRKNTSATFAPPVYDNTDPNPAQWATSPAALNTGEYQWAIQAEKTSAGAMVGTWSDPFRLSGEPGTAGSNAVFYFLLPSVTIIKKSSSGTYDVSSVSCRVMKVDGSSQTVVSSLPSGYSMDAYIDDSSVRNYTPGTSLSTSLITKNVVFRLYRESGSITMIDSKKINVVEDGQKGGDGATYTNVYKTAATQPATPTGSTIPPTGWSLTPTAPGEGTYTWMSQVRTQGGVIGAYSTPIRLSGADGKKGVDGTDIEFIYKTTTTGTKPSTPTGTQADDYIPSGWTDNPSGVSASVMYEWLCVRYKVNGEWGVYSTPALWSKWGETGMDGDGYEYIYRRTTDATQPATPTGSQTDGSVPSGWTDNPTGTTEEYPYEWVCTRKKHNKEWSVYSDPAVWSKFGRDGSDGMNGTSYKPIYKYAFERPAIPTGNDVVPEGWRETSDPDNRQYSNDNVFVANEDGFRYSTPRTSIGTTKEKLSFVTTQKNEKIYITLGVSGHATYSSGLISKLDTTTVSFQNYLYMITGNGTNTFEITVPEPGSHFVYIAYQKRTSATANKEQAWYKISDPVTCWQLLELVQYDPVEGKLVASNRTTPILFLQDTGDYEAIFILSETADIPDTPVTPPGYNKVDDYVPDLWSDEMHGPSSDFPYEFRSERRRVNTGVWGDFGTPVLVAHFGRDGQKGDRGIQTGVPRMTIWQNNRQYEGSSSVVDIVMMLDSNGNIDLEDGNPKQWRAKDNIGLIPIGVSPTSANGSDYWTRMNFYDNVATNLLIATMAIIAGSSFYNNKIQAQIEQSGIPAFLLDGINGIFNCGFGAFTADRSGVRISSNSEGNRIVIDPNSRSIKLIDSTGAIKFNLGFAPAGGYLDFGDGGVSILNDKIKCGDYTTLKNGELNVSDSSSFYVNATTQTLRISLQGLPTSASAASQPYQVYVDSSGYLKLKF